MSNKLLISLSLFVFNLFPSAHVMAKDPAVAKEHDFAILAGGCFWCIENDLQKVRGVIDVVSGYSGGILLNPTYETVNLKKGGHLEVVKVVFDPKVITYPELLNRFWKNIDPTDSGGQFCDRGPQYRSAIFYTNPAQKEQAEKSKIELEKSGKVPFVHTEIKQATQFWPAEEYHQNYAKKNPLKYVYYRNGCRRDPILKRIWGE